MNLTIKILLRDDWSVLKDLWLFALKNDPVPFGSSYEEESNLTDEDWKSKFNNSIKYAALVDGEYVGIAGLDLHKKEKQKHSADIVGFYVKPDFQGKGIGKAILDRIINDAHNIPEIIRLRLFVNSERYNAIKLYEGSGFVQTGVSPKAIKGEDGKYHDHNLMVLFFEDKI